MSEAQQGPAPPWRFELQIHPGNARWRVRHLRLTRAWLTVWSLPVLLYAFALALAVVVSPGVLAGLWSGQEVRSLVAERARQGERLRQLLRNLDQVAGGADQLRQRLEQASLVYGLETPPASPVASPGPGAAALIQESIYTGEVEQGLHLERRARSQLATLDQLLGRIGRHEAEHPDEVRSTPAACPLRGTPFVLASPFGPRRSPFSKDFEPHSGVDLAAAPGSPILAPADGEVVFAGVYPLARSAFWWRLGNLVVLRHGERFLTLYGHCREVKVRPGQRVRLGEALGEVGSSGWSLSPQLYYEVRRLGDNGTYRPVDPLLYILDHRWENEERLLLQARAVAGASGFVPLAPGWEAGGGSGRRTGSRDRLRVR